MNAATKHDEDCWLESPCGDPSCRATKAAAARTKALEGAWGVLELRKESGGLRHYLDGRPVHCGDGLELQGRDFKSDDYGEYTVRLQTGTGVRYEAQIFDSIRATLHVVIQGHEFVIGADSWMRFRWPPEGKRW